MGRLYFGENRTAKQKLQGWLEEHAPGGPDFREERPLLTRLLSNASPVSMIVLAADIRKSTLLMNEAEDFQKFATTITSFLFSAWTSVRGSGGWFDKFTGDGFLAYWIVRELSPGTANDALVTCRSLNNVFHTTVLESFRDNAHNMPGGVGLCHGLDGGPVQLVEVAGDLTIVGRPVVGAVRMSSAAREPRETLVNGKLGLGLYRNPGGVHPNYPIRVERKIVATKEFPKLEAYSVDFIPVATAEKNARAATPGGTNS